MFPVASVKVQVTVVLLAIGKFVVVVPVTAPLQLSVAVGRVNDAIGQVELTGLKFETSATGAVLSPITTLWFCVEVLPAASVKVQTTVVDCVMGNEVVVVPVTDPLQLSVADGAVNDVTEVQLELMALKLAVLGTGAVTSLMITFCCCVVVFPFPSE